MALGDSSTKPIFELGYDARRTSAVPCRSNSLSTPDRSSTSCNAMCRNPVTPTVLTRIYADFCQRVLLWKFNSAWQVIDQKLSGNNCRGGIQRLGPLVTIDDKAFAAKN